MTITHLIDESSTSSSMHDEGRGAAAVTRTMLRGLNKKPCLYCVNEGINNNGSGGGDTTNAVIALVSVLGFVILVSIIYCVVKRRLAILAAEEKKNHHKNVNAKGTHIGTAVNSSSNP